jgi:hypothetical protein
MAASSSPHPDTTGARTDLSDEQRRQAALSAAAMVAATLRRDQ